MLVKVLGSIRSVPVAFGVFASGFLGDVVETAQAQRSTTVAKIMAQRDTTTPDKKKVKYCSGGIFKPCVCAPDVTKKIMYRPSVRECGGNAAVILTGRYASAFSTVLRNGENADRIPTPGKGTVNGCTFEIASSKNPPNKCSVFKAQKVIRLEDDRGSVAVHCMGTKGNSKYGLRARRITVKLADRPNDSSDPLVRACLARPTASLN